ncbi:MAG: transaldolase family protein, partial [Christensenellales bacterium]
THEGMDGLDSVRHNLRMLKNCNLPDTRLIVCSLIGERNYAELDKLLAEPEFQDMNHRVVITTDPNYHSQQATDNQIITYQRLFMNAAASGK